MEKENYVLLKDTFFSRAGTIFYSYHEYYTPTENAMLLSMVNFPIFNAYAIENNSEWFMKESEYNKQQNDLKDTRHNFHFNPSRIIYSKSIEHIRTERDIYKTLCERYMDNQSNNLNNIMKENQQLKEESKALNLTIEKLESKINDVHKEMNVLIVSAQERYDKALLNIKSNVTSTPNGAPNDFSIIKQALKIAAGL